MGRQLHGRCPSNRLQPTRTAHLQRDGHRQQRLYEQHLHHGYRAVQSCRAECLCCEQHQLFQPERQHHRYLPDGQLHLLYQWHGFPNRNHFHRLERGQLHADRQEQCRMYQLERVHHNLRRQHRDRPGASPKSLCRRQLDTERQFQRHIRCHLFMDCAR